MPTEIMNRARVRLTMYIMDCEIFSQVDLLEKKTTKKQRQDAATPEKFAMNC